MISTRLNRMMVSAVMAMMFLSGCRSKQDQAIDEAKKQASSTGQAQQVVSTDSKGNLITTTVQPPVPGQTAQTVTTTVTPPAGAPGQVANVPANGTSVNGGRIGNGEPARAAGYGNGQPARVANGQPAYAANGQPAGSYPAGSDGYVNGQPTNGNQPELASRRTGNPGDPVISPVSIDIPAGTPLAIRINQHISVKTSRAGEGFTGEVVEPVSQDGRIVIPKGTPVGGVIDAAHKRGHFKGASLLELRLTSLTLDGRRYPVSTGDLTRTKKGKGKRSFAFIGGGAGLGAIVGGLAGGGLGAGVGALAGAGAGTAVGGLTGNRDIEIPSESIVRFRLTNDLIVR